MFADIWVLAYFEFQIRRLVLLLVILKLLRPLFQSWTLRYCQLSYLVIWLHCLLYICCCCMWLGLC